MERGDVYDIKKYATDDGPGIRTTIFLKGCPLHCWWCHNPEGQTQKPELMHKQARCIGCGKCAESCTKNAISFLSGRVCIDRKRCNLCGKCSQGCPADALVIVGKVMNVEDVAKEIGEDTIFHDESDGGVTFSGGEPLLQPDFLEALLRKCRDSSIHTAVDTSGYSSCKTIDRIASKADLFLYDIKLMNDRKHRKYTGVSNKPILENFKKLANNGDNVLVRFPMIPGINDDDANMSEMAEFMLSQGVKHICLLPYHRAGIEKYANLGRVYRLNRTRSPSEQRTAIAKGKLESLGLTVRIGGG